MEGSTCGFPFDFRMSKMYSEPSAAPAAKTSGLEGDHAALSTGLVPGSVVWNGAGCPPPTSRAARADRQRRRPALGARGRL